MRQFGKTYRAIVEPDDPRGFIAILPAVPGLMAHGENEQEAIALLRDLLCSHLIRLEDAGETLPEDDIEIVWNEEDEEAGAKLLTLEV